MPPSPVYIILIVLALVLLSGFFSFFESAFNACRILRVKKEYNKRYKAVLKELENPKKLFLACRLWINILRIFAAFFSGFGLLFYILMTEIDQLEIVLIAVLSAAGLGIFSALFTDALPKLFSRIAPEKITAALLPAIKVFSIPMILFILPAIKVSNLFHKIFRMEITYNNITEDEFRSALLESEKHGVVESNERTMVEGVLYLGDRPLGAFMTHRSEIEWLDCNAPYEEIREKALKYREQKCFPIGNGSQDEIVGSVYVEDIILDMASESPRGLREIMMKPYFVPETMSALKAFESFKQQGKTNFLFVMDEYGGLAGIISLTALVEEIIGELSAPVQEEDPPIIQQEDGSWLADGTLNIDDAQKALSLNILSEDGDFHTLAGFVLSLAGELPKVGDSFDYNGYRFKVADKDGNRIDKLIITKFKE